MSHARSTHDLFRGPAAPVAQPAPQIMGEPKRSPSAVLESSALRDEVVGVESAPNTHDAARALLSLPKEDRKLLMSYRAQYDAAVRKGDTQWQEHTFQVVAGLLRTGPTPLVRLDAGCATKSA